MPSNAFFDFFDIPELEGPESLLVVEFELISLLSSSLGGEGEEICCFPGLTL